MWFFTAAMLFLGGFLVGRAPFSRSEGTNNRAFFAGCTISLIGLGLGYLVMK